MKKIIPFKISFEEAKTYQKYANISLWISTGLLVISFIIKLSNKNLLALSDTIATINIFFILAFSLLSFIKNICYYDVNRQKRLDFIDNSFRTNFSEQKSVDYFTNEYIETGIHKMAVNGFENSLFSYHIAKEMLKFIWLKNLFFAVLFLIFAVLGFNSAFILLIQLTLPILLFQQAVKHTLFVYRIKGVFESNRRLFSDLKQVKKKNQKRPEIILNILEYETLLSWAAVPLSTNIYNKMNESLSQKWEEMKKEYEIT